MNFEEIRDTRWKIHLEWMLENEPQASLKLHQADQLGDYLDQKNQEALELTNRFKAEGQSEDEAFENAQNLLLSPPPNRQSPPPNPLSSSQAEEIRRSLLPTPL